MLAAENVRLATLIRGHRAQLAAMGDELERALAQIAHLELENAELRGGRSER